jgi:hypothetical protein
MDDGLRRVQSRACGAWVLPGDPTCAGVARRLFRRVATGLALDPETIDDGVTMVSELAANTLHAGQEQPVSANPELWLYLRGSGQRAELVCKVFDTLPGWVRGNVPGRTVRRAPVDAMSGRGLEVVHELSAGQWGHHLSRARLSGAGLDSTGVDGKAVWFSLPAPAADASGEAGPSGAGLSGAGLSGAGAVSESGCGARPATAAEAMTELEKDLGTRGLDAAMVRADDAGGNMAVLSIVGGLAVWCRGGAAWLRAPGVPLQQWGYCDLVEVGEQAVQAYESIVARAEPFRLANATRAGGLALGDLSGLNGLSGLDGCRRHRVPARFRYIKSPRSGEC